MTAPLPYYMKFSRQCNFAKKKVSGKFAAANILRLQPCEKAAMLVVNTKEIFLQNLHRNRVHFPAEKNSFVFDHQHGCRDVTCKPAIT